MKIPFGLRLVFIALFVSTLSVRAADLAGIWTSEFDSQIGKQKYTYEFKKDGEVYTGKANAEVDNSKKENVLSDITVKDDAVTFVEKSSYDGNDLRISYTGKIIGDEMKLTRNVAEFATEEIVAKRVPAAAAPAPKK